LKHSPLWAGEVSTDARGYTNCKGNDVEASKDWIWLEKKYLFEAEPLQHAIRPRLERSQSNVEAAEFLVAPGSSPRRPWLRLREKYIESESLNVLYPAQMVNNSRVLPAEISVNSHD
jgi:hypothetical protein